MWMGRSGRRLRHRPPRPASVVTRRAIRGADRSGCRCAAAPLRLLVDGEAEDWRRTLEINVVAVNQPVRALLPHMAPGGIVAVLIAERRPPWTEQYYAASKVAQEASQGLAPGAPRGPLRGAGGGPHLAHRVRRRLRPRLARADLRRLGSPRHAPRDVHGHRPAGRLPHRHAGRHAGPSGHRRRAHDAALRLTGDGPEGHPWTSVTSPTLGRGLRQAARRGARPGPRADAGAALRHPAARPPRRRGGQDRAPTRRDGPRLVAGDDRPRGAQVGATFLRNNLDKRSVGIDLKHLEGASWSCGWPQLRRRRRELQGRRTMDRLGLGYDDVAAVHPGSSTCRCRASATSDRRPRRRLARPAYAPIAEAMSGIYEYEPRDQPPVAQPGGRPRRHRAACSARSACSRRCATATGPARASTSTSPCSTRWWP